MVDGPATTLVAVVIFSRMDRHANTSAVLKDSKNHESPEREYEFTESNHIFIADILVVIVFD